MRFKINIQLETIPLPALRLPGDDGQVVSCWKLSFKERLRVLFLGRVWLSMSTFNRPLTPSYLTVDRKEVYSHTDDNKKWHERLRTKIETRLNKNLIK